MQNISNTGKDSQAKPEELNMTKLVDNGEILTSDNEPLSKNPACSTSIKEQMSEFQKERIMKNIWNIKVMQRKHTTKMNPSYPQSVSGKPVSVI